jgi:subtilisin family serine protease
MIVAGATTRSGALAHWSSKASSAQKRYLAAPGENVIVNCDERYCQLASGTSYSVAYVAGALSLLMAAHPQLSAPQAADMLLAGASDRGRKGNDPVAGAGVLDVSRALRIADGQAARQKAS